MKAFIICDSRSDFLQDIKTAFMLESYPIETKLCATFQEACAQAAKYPGASIVLSETVLKNTDLSALSREAYGYAVTPNGARVLQAAGIPSLGLFRTSNDLLEALSVEPLKIVKAPNPAAAAPSPAPRQPQGQSRQSQTQPKQPARDPAQPTQRPRQDTQPQPEPRQPRQPQSRQDGQQRPQQGQKQAQRRESTQTQPQNAAQRPERLAPAPIRTPAPEPQYEEYEEYQENEEETAPAQPSAPAPQPAQPNMQMTPEMMAMMMQMMQQMGMAPVPPQQDIAQTAPDYSKAGNTPVYEPEPEIEAEPELYENDAYEDEPYDEPEPRPRAPVSVGAEMRGRKRGHDDSVADASIDEDLLAHAIAEERTKVITVYAAKGGVGKTSIATELAVCLALTSNGRRRFRVCIVDYNIDFGDVATTLEFDESGPNMSYWAAEIRELIERGENPDTLQFTKVNMESHYLQKMKDTGLYGLCAPITHEDSMLIKPPELEVMLRNIVENGEFDFVICDTGNNTRDSSIIALDHSEYILLVATQDVTTATCNASVLRTLQDSGFDTDKVRLVINNAMPSRETGISIQEVEESFPYPCICRIKRTSDIIKANNLSRPLVYKPNHEYTKQIQRIVRFVTQGDIPDEPKKKGLFGFLR